VTGVWVTIAVLFVGTVAFKAAGPAILRDRTPSRRVLAVIGLVAPAVLTALVLDQALADTPSGIAVDARLAGLAAAGVGVALRWPMLAVVVLAAATTAGLRAAGLG
jgi:uncharacterized membrane protein